MTDDTINWRARAEAAERSLDELQRTFDLRWDADMRACKRWQVEQPGRELTWPDHVDLVIWLAGKLDAAERERDELLAAIANPIAVHINMLSGKSAKPSLANIKHTYPEIDVTITRLRSLLAEAREGLVAFVVPRDGSHAGAREDSSPVFGFDGHLITVGDFRRAASLAARIEKEISDEV